MRAGVGALIAVPFLLSLVGLSAVSIGGCGEISKRFNAREKEVSAASHGGKCRQAGDLFPDRAFGDLEFKRAVLAADDRVPLVAELVKVSVVHPYVLGKLELPDQAGAEHECGYAALCTVLPRVLRQMRSVGSAAADHAAAVHVRGCIAGIHAAYVCAERHRVPARVHVLVGEVIVAL